MSKLIITGGSTLKGEIQVSGAKNSSLVIMAASILGSGSPTYLTNVPSLRDIEVMSSIIQSLGIDVVREADGVRIDASSITSGQAPYDLVTKMRASFFILGPLLARLGHARVPLPGGCKIGSRPVDLHLKGLKALGAEVQIEHGYVIASAEALIGDHVYLDYPSVGATENIMMAATLASGKTVIENAAQEPEVVDLAQYLISMGAKINGAGTETIEIEGVPALNGSSYRVMPDRIEAGTFLIAGALPGNDLIVKGVQPQYLQAAISKLIECGVQIEILGDERVRVRSGEYIKPTDIRTLPYPGYPTDLQAPFATLLAMAKGTSIVTETVFENRFLHVDELLRMGAQIKIEGNCAVIQGVPSLSGAPVKATDLRAGAALVIAGLAANGQTEVTGLHHIDRGYEDLVTKLQQVGANIQRVAIDESSPQYTNS